MTVFAINETEFGWEEIVAAAQGWGEWQPFVVETRQALACLAYASETNQLPSANEVREAATAFRYAHNLISAEETQAWLDRWEMTANDWMNCLRGQLLIQRWATKLDLITAAHPISEEDAATVLKDYAVCADQLQEWAQKLAGRAAMASRAAESGWFDAATGSPRDLANLIGRIEAEFDRQRQHTVTPKLVETKISDHRLDWIRFDCRYLWFAEERVAREAHFCVTEDGLTLDEVAADAHSLVRQWSFYLDEIEASVRPYFLAARQGDWLGPMRIMNGFPLFSVVRKQMPAADDPRIKQRAEQAIIGGLMEQAINERVKWMM
jgi:hypothetical protein